MKKILLSAVIFTVSITAIFAQDPSAALQVDATDKGFLPPRMTSAQMQAISSPAEGLIIYCTDCNPKGLYVYDGTDFLPLLTGTVTPAVTTITGAGGATWMDRNLGATQVATSSTDAAAYGGLYQWGRNTDGHEVRTSSTTAGPVASGSEGSNFIANTSNSGDWLTTSDGTRWNDTTKGAHDPCPSGFRVPSRAEWNTEMAAWASQDTAGAFNALKLTLAGWRIIHDGSLSSVGTLGSYWTSTEFTGSSAYIALFNSSIAHANGNGAKSRGNSVRCIQE